MHIPGLPRQDQLIQKSLIAGSSSLHVWQASQMVLTHVQLGEPGPHIATVQTDFLLVECLTCPPSLTGPSSPSRGGDRKSGLNWAAGSSTFAHGKIHTLAQQLQIRPKASVLRKCSVNWSVNCWKEGTVSSIPFCVLSFSLNLHLSSTA